MNHSLIDLMRSASKKSLMQIDSHRLSDVRGYVAKAEKGEKDATIRKHAERLGLSFNSLKNHIREHAKLYKPKQ